MLLNYPWQNSSFSVEAIDKAEVSQACGPMTALVYSAVILTKYCFTTLFAIEVHQLLYSESFIKKGGKTIYLVL